ncbi:hypothetical protein ACFOPQ_09685 [Deinococcus antarcticus]|uniref:Uncharacterized protein n=1 Tax=Deinococcus antarcticus TaxID=1298767 RepID=A0ABV8A6Z0_9DEIO
MKANDFMLLDTEVWVRLIALEKKWGTQRDEVLNRALHECRGVRSELNALLRTWMYPKAANRQRRAEGLPDEAGWMIRGKIDA